MKKISILLILLFLTSMPIANAAVTVNSLKMVNPMGQSLYTADNKIYYSGEKAVAASASITGGDVDEQKTVTLSYYENGILKNTVSESLLVEEGTTVIIKTPYLMIDKTPEINIGKCVLKAMVVGEQTIETVGIGQYDIVKGLTPFYNSTTIYDESVMMVVPVGGGLAEADLLFTPTEIISVKNAGQDYEFIEGIDWIFEDGKIKLLDWEYRADRLTQAELYPIRGTYGADVYGKKGGGYVIYGEGLWQKQLSVTYTHAGDVWDGPVYRADSDVLPKTKAKLLAGQPLKVVTNGDSISAGSGASRGAAPFMPTWSELFVRNLRNYYSSDISFKNTALGGMTASWGANATTLTTIKAENPDLVTIGFGANDASGSVPKATFKTIIKTMIDSIRAARPDCEFVLVATTVANPESTNVPNDDFFTYYLEALNELKAEDLAKGIEVLDMTTTHRKLISEKKFIDITASNVNHQNDYTLRWFAQHLTAMFVN